jgi:hypothetical protein
MAERPPPTHQDALERTADESACAPFDDSRKALTFALNAHQARLPPTYMSKVMYETPGKPAKVAKTKAAKALQFLREEEAKAEAERKAGRRLGPGPWPASALDRVHLAGYILHHFASIDIAHQVVLSLRLVTPAVECNCGSPCCSGWRPVPRWVTAVTDACELLKTRAIMLANEGAIPGAPMKVGMSTQPQLRRQLVKEWATRRWSTRVDLAQRFGLTAMWVSRHRAWIEEWLDTQENNAWIEVDSLFDRTGITGPSV